MVYRLLADIVVLIHVAFVIYVVLGGLLILKWRRTVWLHLPAVLWGAVVEFSGSICPLTPLENKLRNLAADSVYQTGFIEHYILPILYPAALSENTQIILGSLVLIINVVIYGVVWMRSGFRRCGR
jgi:hypothetical protein